MIFKNISPAKGSKKKSKRLGRGIGSTLGKTCGRGHKGFKARSGSGIRVGFEGGQMPLQRRLPKFGFKSTKKDISRSLNIGIFLNDIFFQENKGVSIGYMKEMGLLPKYIKNIKLIFNTKLTEDEINKIKSKKLVFNQKEIRFSESVKKVLEIAST